LKVKLGRGIRAVPLVELSS